MSKSQNTKNEQQKDLCITVEQLTEQMHKRELPEGWYFVILNNGKVDIAKCSNLFINCGRKLKRNFAINNVAEVIEPICYEKWQAVNQNMDSVMQTNQALCKKLAELKELLKECKEVIKNVDTYYGNYDSIKGDLVINKIDEVL